MADAFGPGQKCPRSDLRSIETTRSSSADIFWPGPNTSAIIPLVENTEFDRRAARAARIEDAFLWPTTIAALICLPAFLVPLLTSDPLVKEGSHIADWAIWSVFAVEMIVLVIVTPDRRAFLRHHRLLAFILIAAFPGFAVVFEGFRLDGLTPALLLVQKLLKLAKVDKLIRKRTIQTRIPGGRWLLIAPAAVADILVWEKLGFLTALTLAIAFLLGIIGPGGRPDPGALWRLRDHARGLVRSRRPA